MLDLDGKVDYLDLLDYKEARTKFWLDMEKAYLENPDELDRIRSEVIHHQYFHLDDEDSKNEDLTALIEK